MEILQLEDKHFLGKGGQRECYLHPHDKTKVLKIMYRCNSYKEDVNKLEYLYMKILKKRNVSFKHLSICNGFFKTNRGTALVFDRVVNFDGTPSMSFREAILKNKIKYNEQINLLNNLKEYLFRENILFIDYSLDNLFVKEYKENKFILVIIDGLGAKRLDIKFWFYSYILLYTKVKIKKQWKKFILEYKFERDLINNLKNYSKGKLEVEKLKSYYTGNCRKLYIHPYDEKKIIKKSYIPLGNIKNLYDYKYFEYLKKENKDLRFLSSCYGYQKVNDGSKALIYELIVDYDDIISKHLSFYIKSKIIDKKELMYLLFNLSFYLEKNEILLSEINTENILCQKSSTNKYQLFIVDGFNIKTNGLSFLFYRKISFYRNYLLKKQTKYLYNIILKDIKMKKDFFEYKI